MSKGELKNIQWEPVESSQIEAIAMEPDYSDTLYVKFHKGGIYAYDGANADVFRALKESDSKGSYLHRHIKGYFPDRKLS